MVAPDRAPPLERVFRIDQSRLVKTTQWRVTPPVPVYELEVVRNWDIWLRPPNRSCDRMLDKPCCDAPLLGPRAPCAAFWGQYSDNRQFRLYCLLYEASKHAGGSPGFRRPGVFTAA